MNVQIVGGPYNGKEVGLLDGSTYLYLDIPGPVTLASFNDNPCLEVNHTIRRIPISPCKDVITGKYSYIALWDDVVTC